MNLTRVRELLLNAFSAQEFRLLCDDLQVAHPELHVHYESVTATTQTYQTQVHDVLYYLGRLGEEAQGVEKLVALAKQRRKFVNWETTDEKQQSITQSITPLPAARDVYNIEKVENSAFGPGATIINYPQPEKKAASSSPEVKVIFHTHTLPTAYISQLSAKQFAFVTVQINGLPSMPEAVKVITEMSIEEYSHPTTHTITVNPGEQSKVDLLPILKPAAFASFKEKTRGVFRLKVRQVSPVEKTLYDQTEMIHLLAHDVAVLAMANEKAEGEKYVDLTSYLSAWVTPRAIESFLHPVTDYLPQKKLVGYQTGKREDVREQVQAIYLALRHYPDLRYVSSTLAVGIQEGYVAQRVRWPQNSLSKGVANCIDATVLFASVMELFELSPLLVLIPGHAFLGWRVWEDEDEDEVEFLETTVIQEVSFERAMELGQNHYKRAKEGGYFQRDLFHLKGFARLIDVQKCRQQGITPLE